MSSVIVLLVDCNAGSSGEGEQKKGRPCRASPLAFLVGQGGVEPPTLGFSERKGEKWVISKPLIFGLISRQIVKRLGNLISICSAQICLFNIFLLSLITYLSQMTLGVSFRFLTGLLKQCQTR